MKSLKAQLINEDNFGYIWQNAFITSIVTLINIGEEDSALKILKQWFTSDSEVRGITTFLYHIGYDMTAIGNKTERTPENLLELLKTVIISKNMTIQAPK